MLVPGMYLADRYEIIEKIGSGGMADVYKAKCHKLNRLVAIKVLKNEFSTDAAFVKKFRVEAQSSAGLSHPNIVSVYDVGEESGIYYIVMELVQGITLKNYIDMKGKLEIREALNISIQIASGLSAAHSNRIIHRDIKPQNIIMSRDGKVKVTDFGIAKVADSTTVTTSAAGSVHYISPEQARGGYSDEKSDIYSLGITMYEMVTGKVPFDGETNVAVALKHIQGEMVPPRRLEPSIPRSFEKIILKCTQKKSDRRYNSAKELIADLRRVLSNPDGEYVVLAGASADGATMVMSEDDLAQMRSQSAPSQQGQMAKPPQRREEVNRQQMQQQDRYNQTSEDDDDEDDDDEEVNPKLEKIMIVLGIVGAVILVIAICFIIGRMAGVFGGGGESEDNTTVQTESQSESQAQVVMISVVGYTQEEATDKLIEAGITNYRFEEQASDEDQGKIINQTPTIGTMLDGNTEVIIYVSSGKETFKLSGYTDLTQSQAENKLAADGLVRRTIMYEYSDTIAEGKVTRTDPAEDTEVSKGDEITLYLSRGKETKVVAMPTLIGRSETEAWQAVATAGLTKGSSTTQYSNDYSAGQVISFTVDGQSVNAGTNVNQGATVNIVVSAGSENVRHNFPAEMLGDTTAEHTISVYLNSVSAENKVTDLRIDSSTNWPVEFYISRAKGDTVTIIYVENGAEIGREGPVSLGSNGYAG